MVGNKHPVSGQFIESRLVFLLGLAALCSCGGSGGEHPGAAASPGKQQEEARQPAGSSVHASPAATSSEAVTPRIESYLCGLDCAGAGPLDARTAAEAMWLIKHGYPSAFDRDRLQSLSRAELLQLVGSGSLPGAVELGKRVALEDNVLDGKIILRQQANAGNMYAYYGLADVSAKSQPRSLVDAAAYLRMAYMLGDDKAASEIAKLRLTSAELVAADKRASHLFGGYAGEQARDPRPQK